MIALIAVHANRNVRTIGRNFENQRWVHGAGGAGDGGGSLKIGVKRHQLLINAFQ